MSGIPVLHVQSDCIARGWEESLIELNRKGCSFRTEYDKAGDPPSKDSTMILAIADPLSEPMIHRDFPGGPLELQEYVMEVCEGIKDHLIRNPEDPEDTRPKSHIHGVPRRLHGRFGKTMTASIRPAFKAYGAGLSRTTEDGCSA
jgi:thymidylate synthase